MAAWENRAEKYLAEHYGETIDDRPPLDASSLVLCVDCDAPHLPVDSLVCAACRARELAEPEPVDKLYACEQGRHRACAGIERSFGDVFVCRCTCHVPEVAS